MSVPLSALQVGKRIGDGSQGEVFLVENRPHEVFKRYRDNALPKLRPNVLEELVTEAAELQLEGKPITHWAAWPTDTVSDMGRIVGFLMPLLDPAFSLSGGNLEGKNASFSYLAAIPAPLWGEVQLPSQPSRMRLLGLLAGVIQQLHHRKMVVGDLSWANVLWAQAPDLRVILLDCDGIRPPKGTPVSPQLDSPDWDDPLASQLSPPDADRDCYKFSLMALRVLCQDLNARPSPNGGHMLHGLSSETANAIDGLLVRSAGAPGSRPTATEWRQVLQGRSVQRVSRPARPITPELHWPRDHQKPAGAPIVRKTYPVGGPAAPVQPPAPSPQPRPATRDARPITPSPNTGRRWKPIDPGPAQP